MNVPVASTEDAPQPILAAVDFSPASREALVVAARLARLAQTPLRILHVVHEPGEAPNFYQRQGESEAVWTLESLADRMLRKFVLDVSDANPEFDVLKTPDIILVSGLPSTRISEVAMEQGAATIVMGYSERKGALKSLVLPLAEKVARKCPLPVTAVSADGATHTLNAQAHPDIRADRPVRMGAGLTTG